MRAAESLPPLRPSKPQRSPPRLRRLRGALPSLPWLESIGVLLLMVMLLGSAG